MSRGKRIGLILFVGILAYFSLPFWLKPAPYVPPPIPEFLRDHPNVDEDHPHYPERRFHLYGDSGCVDWIAATDRAIDVMTATWPFYSDSEGRYMVEWGRYHTGAWDERGAPCVYPGLMRRDANESLYGHTVLFRLIGWPWSQFGNWLEVSAAAQERLNKTNGAPSDARSLDDNDLALRLILQTIQSPCGLTAMEIARLENAIDTTTTLGAHRRRKVDMLREALHAKQQTYATCLETYEEIIEASD